jgi:ferredoxin
MPISKLWIEDGCTSCGLCEEICPEVFELQDIAVIKEGVDFNDYEDGIKESADSCPVEVIQYEE